MATRVLAVVGPTASGKTALAVELALRLGGEVVSCDSMQVYRDMRIAAAVPDEEERRGVPHHMMEILDPEESFSVARYCEMAGACIDDIAARGRLPILCGGTGLYYSSLADGIAFAELPEQPELRERLRERALSEGGEVLLAELREIDPETAAKLAPADHKRIIRALEVYAVTGVTMAEHVRRSRLAPPRFDVTAVGISYADRQRLYDRIDRRVDMMLEAGLVEETRRFFAEHSAATAAQAIGYKELRPWLCGECSKEEAVESLKRETRRFAKRQLSWFRRDGRIMWISADDESAAGTVADRACAMALEKERTKENG